MVGAAFRKALSVSHDARGFLLTSKGMNGWSCTDIPDDKTLSKAVFDGAVMPISMASKQGGTHLRVLLNKPLTRREQEECFDHFAWKLNIPDGQFALVGGGYEYMTGKNRNDYTAMLEVPPDLYRVDVHICFVGVNGPGFYEESRDTKLIPEPIGTWFRRTRPGKRLPSWLRLHCYEDPDADPGHQEDYDDETFDYDEAEEMADVEPVDFVVQLTPLAKAEPLPDAPQSLDRGWFDLHVNPRLLDKCPRGFQAKADDE